MLFLGFGTVQESERPLLINAFLIETAVAIGALFYSLFNLRKAGDEKAVIANGQETMKLKENSIKMSHNNLIIKVLVYKSQHGSYQKELHQYLKHNIPNNADFIEYSTATIAPILQQLTRNRCKIRILLQHPDTAISKLQKNRISSSLDDLVRRIFDTYDHELIELRLYCLPASIRGRNFDNQLVSVGWYTYSSDSKEYANIHGDTNPMINIDTDNKYGQTLLRFFTESFNRLWEHPGTVRLDPPWETPIPTPTNRPKWYLTASSREGQS